MKRVILYITLTFSGALLISNISYASVAGFNAGRIIEDDVFTNYSTMSVSQIQEFLKSKLPVCDTWGSQQYSNGQTRAQYAASKGIATPFTCLKDYSEGGRNASQIIFDAANTYRINPQVLIVLLQKEQGLVTDDWPWPIQYRSATGYGCPDTADCSSQYYGFANQVNWAARMFRLIMDNNPNWYTPYVLGQNYIQYNPATSCGGSTVNIQNRATQALYNYTPYQPNQAALDAGWGTAPCGAYGNRNFYLYFNEWFGGYLIETVNNGNLYVRGNNKRYYQISSYAQYQGLGLESLRVYKTTSSYLNNLVSGGTLSSAVTFGGDGTVYALDRGTRHYFSWAAYNAYGAPAVSDLAKGLDQAIPQSFNMTTVISLFNDGTLYAVSGGKKHHISSSVYTNDGYSSTQTSPLSHYYLSTLPKGYPLLASGSIMYASDTNEHSIVSGNRASRRHLEKQTASSLKLGVYTDTSQTFSDLSLVNEPPVTNFVADSKGNLYLIDGTKKLLLTPQSFQSLNIPASQFSQTDESFLSRFETKVTAAQPLLVWIESSPQVYKIEQGELVSIQNAEDFDRMNYKWPDVTSISKGLAEQFRNNNRSMVVGGTPMRIGSDPTVYLMDSDSNLHVIPTADMFTQDFRKSWSQVRSVSSSTFSYYTLGSSLSQLVRTADGDRWFVTNGVKYRLRDEVLMSYGKTNQDVVLVDARSVNPLTTGPDATRFIRINDGAKVYYIENGMKHPLESVGAFHRKGGTSWNQVMSVSNGASNLFSTGAPLY